MEPEYYDLGTHCEIVGRTQKGKSFAFDTYETLYATYLLRF